MIARLPNIIGERLNCLTACIAVGAAAPLCQPCTPDSGHDELHDNTESE
ncbi:hypothetical protein [Ferruginibacter sp.]